MRDLPQKAVQKIEEQLRRIPLRPPPISKRAWIFLGIASLFVFFSTSLVLIYSARVRNQFLHLAQLAVLSKTGLAVTARGATVDIFPPRLHVYGLSVRRPGEAPFFTTEEIRIAPGVTRSLTGRIAFDWLEIRSPDISLTYVDGEIAELHDLFTKRGPHEESSFDKIPIELWGGLVTRGRVHISVPGRAQIYLDGLNIFAAPSARGKTQLEMVVPPATVVMPDRTVTLHDLKLALLFTGPNLLAPKRVSLKELQFISDVASLQTAGDMDMESKSGNGNLHFNVDLEVLSALFPEVPKLRGRVAVGATLNADVQPAQLDLELDGANLEAAGIPIGNVQANVGATQYDIDVRSLVLRAARGEAKVSGHITPVLDLPLQMQVQWTGLELAEILDAVGLKDPWVTLRSNGTAKIAGHLRTKGLTDPVFRGPVHIDVVDMLSGDRSFRMGDRQTILHLAKVAIDGKLTLFTDRLEFGDVHLKGEPGTMDVECRFYFNKELGFHINGESDELNLAAFGPVAGIALTGIGPLHFTLGGPYGPPTINAQITMEQASVAGISLGALDSGVVFRDKHTLEFPDAVATYGNTAAEGHGDIDMNAGPALAISGKVTHGELADLHALLPLPHVLLDGLNGDVSGEFAIHGPAATPEAEFDFRSDGLEVLGQPLGKTQGEASIERGHFARMQASAQMAGGNFTLAVEDEEDGMSVDVDVNAANVSELRFLQGARRGLGGKLSGSGSALWGKKKSGEASLHIDDAAIVGHNEGAISASLVLDGDLLHTDIAGLQGRLVASTDIHLAEHTTFSLVAQLAPGEYHNTLPLPDSFRVSGSALLDLHGDFQSLQALSGTLDFHGLHLSAPQLDLQAKSDAHLVLHDRAITFQPVEFSGHGSDISVSGEASLDGTVQVTTDGTLAADSLQPFIPHVETLAGVLPLRLQIGGSLTDLEMTGRASTEHARLKFDFLDNVFSDLSGDIDFTGHTLVFRDLQADAGDGEVTGGGELRLQGAEFAGLSFDLELQSVAYVAPGDIPMRLTGRIKVDTNSDKTFGVGGDLRLTDLRFTKDLSMDKLFKSHPTVTHTLDKNNEQVTFNVDMRADDMQVADNYANLQAKTDRLTLTGTNLRPGLIGTVTVTRGEFYFDNVTYNIASGVVEFNDRYQIIPRFNFRTTAEACGAKIEVNLSGTFEKPEITPRGRDSQGVLSSEDALSCLMFGYRASDQAHSGVGTGQSAGAQAGVSVLSTVTGLDQKIKQFIPVDQIRFGYGFSMRTLRNTPQVTLEKDLYGGLKLSLTSSLIDTNDQTLELKVPLMQYTSATIGWTNTNDVPNDFGIDLRSHINF